MRSVSLAARNARILVIDDQENIHSDYRKIIDPKPSSCDELIAASANLFGDVPPPLNMTQTAFEIDSAFQGAEGFAMVRKALDRGRPYAMAFVDIRMPPGWDGIETVQRIWEIDPEILIVLCSAYSDYSWEDVVERLGRTDRFLILKKPFDSIEVRQFAMALTERWNLARIDVLTQVLNRRAMHEQLQREWALSVRNDTPLSCVMLDLDFFKQINDTQGHRAGDEALRTVADLLQLRCREGDLLYRYGGEEFCVLLPLTTEAGASVWAEDARALIASAPVRHSKGASRITASVGVAQRSAAMLMADDLVECADLALRSAKQTGRNRVVHYSSTQAGQPRQNGVEPPAYVLFSSVVARDVMSGPVATLERTMTVGEAARFFLDKSLNSAPIVDDEGRLAAMLCERDVLSVMLLPESWNWPIGRISQRDVLSYDEGTPLDTIFEFLTRVTMRRVLILRDGRPVGNISRSDLLRWFCNWVAAQSVSLSDSAEEVAESPRTRMVVAAQLLATRAAHLCADLSSSKAEPPLSDDLYGPLIGVVSVMQELLKDIIQFARAAAPLASSPEPIPLLPDLAVPSTSPGSDAPHGVSTSVH